MQREEKGGRKEGCVHSGVLELDHFRWRELNFGPEWTEVKSKTEVIPSVATLLAKKIGNVNLLLLCTFSVENTDRRKFSLMEMQLEVDSRHLKDIFNLNIILPVVSFEL